LQEFDDRGVASLDGWFSASECEKAVVEEVQTNAGKKALSIRAGEGEACVASWRRHVLLGPGHYTVKAAVRTDRVVKLQDTDNSGVGVGISGVERDQHLHGTTASKTLSYRFQVRDDRKDAVLVLELRALSGQVWFDPDSIRLIREDGARVP